MSDESLGRGFAFYSGEVLRQTQLGEPYNGDSLFSSQLDDIHFLKGRQHAFIDFDTCNVLHLPSLEIIDATRMDEIPSSAEAEGNHAPTVSGPSSHVQYDASELWAIEIGHEGVVEPLPTLRTWEAFENNEQAVHDSPRLSEANDHVQNAALWRLQSREPSPGVLPQPSMLRPLCSLVMGRSSVFFSWNSGKQTFEPVLPEVPISGFSMACQSSFLEAMIDCGSRFRRLSEHASVRLTTRSCPARVALNACISTILDGMEENFTLASANLIFSMLQLQALVRRPHDLLCSLSRLIACLPLDNTDEVVLSSLSNEIEDIVASNHTHSVIMQEILARVSWPWLCNLFCDLTLNSGPAEASRVLAQDDDRESNNSTREAERPEEAPDFLQAHDCAVIGEMKASLRILRCAPSFRQPTVSTAEISPFAMAFKDCAPHSKASSLDVPNGVSANSVEGLAWSADAEQYNYLSTLSNRMTEAPPIPHEDRLQTLVHARTNASETSNNGYSDDDILMQMTTSHWDPLHRIRPLMLSHASDISKAALRCLIQHHHLLHHMNVLRQYFLFGNGSFVDRLATALFSMESQSAHRTRENVPNARAIGLRLGIAEKQRWPPARSEVQLSLMNILPDTYPSRGGVSMPNVMKDDLPGGLSFSIRELSDSEIERVSNPRSIHALDFLRLQYTAIAPLDVILTPSCLKLHDDAFRFLLKLLRAVHVTTMLRRRSSTHACLGGDRTGENAHDLIRFSSQAHHFVSTLMSYCMDVGVGTPWVTLVSSMKDVEETLTREDGSKFIGLDGLRGMYDSFLGSMRSRLFLRKKHCDVQDAIDGVLTAILDGSAALEDGESPAFNEAEQTLQTQIETLIGLLQTAVNRVAKRANLEERAEEDLDALRMLLLRFNWNGSTNDQRYE